MTKAQVAKVLSKRPFAPLVVHLDDGRAIDIPFAHVAILLTQTLLVMLGVKNETSRRATGKVEFAYDRIERIEPRKSRNGERRRKAS